MNNGPPLGPPGALPLSVGAAPSTFGDAALEHLHMKRGRYNAWAYVVIAFLGETMLLGSLPSALLGRAAGAFGASRDATEMITIGALLLGLPLAYLVFRDRWRCIEAFSSRFCVGLMNISMLFVPIVALVYANVRGAQKLAHR